MALHGEGSGRRRRRSHRERCRRRLMPVLYINAKVMATDGEVQRGQLALMALHGDEGGRRRRCMAKAAVVPHREATAADGGAQHGDDGGRRRRCKTSRRRRSPMGCMAGRSFADGRCASS